MFSQDNYTKALKYATDAYSKKNESNGLEAHTVHINLVAMEVINACVKSKVDDEKANLAITCALLHNIIDDTNITYDELYVDFSEAVANAVESLSRDESISSKQDQMKKSIEMLLEQPYEVQMVKLADLITNLSNLVSQSGDNKKTYLKEVGFIYSCLKNSNIYLSSRLEEKIEEFKNLIE